MITLIISIKYSMSCYNELLQCFIAGTEQALITLASLRANLPDPPDSVDEQLINTKVTFLSEESFNVGSLDMRNIGGIQSLRGCRGSFQTAWTMKPGTGNLSDMCYTPAGLLAVARGLNNNVMLYDGNGLVVKESRSAGVTLTQPTGIAYYPPEKALAVMELSSGDIVLLDAVHLGIQRRRIWLNTEGKGHRVAVLGDDFVTVWENKKDSGRVWIGVHNKEGKTLNKWRSGSSGNCLHFVTTHKDHIYVADGRDKLFVYSHNGDLLTEVTIDLSTYGVVCLAEETLVAVSDSPNVPGHLMSIPHTEYSVEDVLTWGEEQMDKFGCMQTLAVYRDHVAVGGDDAICVYKVITENLTGENDI